VYGSALSRAPEEEEAAPSSPRGLFGRHGSKPQDCTSSSSSIKGFLGHYRPSIAKRGIEHSHSLDDVDAMHHDDQLHHHSPFFVTQPAHDLQTVQEKGACGVCLVMVLVGVCSGILGRWWGRRCNTPA
jgi:hypothetical protein